LKRTPRKPARIQARELGVRHRRVEQRNAAVVVRSAGDGVLGDCVVQAVAGGLHDDAALQAKRSLRA
jgi:hypothetical protein